MVEVVRAEDVPETSERERETGEEGGNGYGKAKKRERE